MRIVDRFKMMAARLRREPKRDTNIYPRIMQLGLQTGGDKRRALLKPTPPNLRYFSRTPYVRRAINSIKNPIKQLEWEIVPIRGVKLNKALEKQIEVVSYCLHRPNYDDNFHSLIEKVIEDYCVFGAGVLEQQLSNDPARPLWLWPVDAQSIQIYAGWSGNQSEARYLQTIGYSNIAVDQGPQLRNDEIIYIKNNPSSESPYGYGPVEIAFNNIARILGTAQYAGDVASNAQPQSIVWLGDVDESTIRTFRNYWINEIEGQGKTPFIGGKQEPKVANLHTGTDNALYLKYQDFILRELAAAFDISPQNLGIEADVNRSTAEVAEDRDWNSAIKPTAQSIAAHLTRFAIQQRLGFQQLQFKFIGLDREDEQATAKIYETYYKNNLLTPNEQRDRLGLAPLDNQWADLTYADTQIALSAARGTKQIDDKNLQNDEVNQPSSKQNE